MEWFDIVKDGLPEDGYEVIVWDGWNYYDICSLKLYDELVWEDKNFKEFSLKEFKYWFPLPNYPEIFLK